MSQKSKQPAVQIVNPIGERRYTSAKHARLMVERGTASWVNEDGISKIRLDETHHAVQMGVLIAARLVRRGEGTGMAGLEAVEGLPVAGPAIRVFTGPKPKTPVVDYSTIQLSARGVDPFAETAQRIPAFTKRVSYPASCRILAGNGQWHCPPDARPTGWQRMGLSG